MSSPELEKELGELKNELFKLRFSLATNGLENPMRIKEVRKAIEDAKQANEAKTVFLANTSHEIRTPMNSILGFCELSCAKRI